MKHKAINPDKLFNSVQHGFSQIVESRPGKHIFLSGQVAWDKNSQIVGPGDLEKQTQQTFENIKIAMEAAGGGMEDIVMLRIYIVNYQQKDSDIISDALKRNFGTQSPPASTWINVQGLANEEFLIEVEAQAVI